MRIFVASTGRCGTMFFYQMFNQFTTIPSYHEPSPLCIGETLRSANNDEVPNEKAKAEIKAKIEQVRFYTVRGMYFESSQMFIKCYAFDVLNAFDDVYCIYLYRNAVDVLISHYKKCKNQEADWTLQSHWEFNRLRTKARLSFYENVLWQSFEVRERYLFFKPAFKKTFEFNFGDINNEERWQELFEAFGVETRRPRKKPLLAKNELPGDADACYEEMLKKWDLPPRKAEAKYREAEKSNAVIEKAAAIVSGAGRRDVGG